MKKLIAGLLLPITLAGQVTSPPTTHDEGENPDSGGTEVVSQGTLTITNLTIKGDLTVTDGGFVIFKPDPDPDPDPQPGPNPDPANKHPVARMTYSPTAGDFPLLVSVDGTTSTDSDGTIASYSWNWGDGTVTTGSTSSHTYASAGNYGITLTVTDDDGATSTTAPRIVNVTTAPVNQNPVASFTRTPATGTAPLAVNVDGTGSYDTDGTISSYAWDFFGGTPATGTGSTSSTTYNSAGTYTITLTVTDNDALTSTATLNVEVAATPVEPVASFTRSPTSGNNPLTVYVDASGSSDPDGTISSYSWNWGDSTPAGSGVTANHTYTTAGNYGITLTVTDNDNLAANASLPVQVYDNGLPPYTITTDETGYRHTKLSWTDDQTWSYPWLIQRSTTASFTNPTDLTDNQSVSTFRWLGVNADNYTDIEDLAEGTLYYYRVAACTNLADHYLNGTAPQFTTWKYGAATTSTLTAGKKLTYDVTSYGAIAGDGNNDITAIKAALAAAEAAGGGIVYLPTGTYDIWPIDADVDQEAGGQIYLPFGDSVDAFLFQIGEDNITFLGDAGATKINCYLWNKQPATSYLSLRDATNNETGIRRYYVFQTSGLVQDFTLKNLEIDMRATPVDSGKEPGIPKTQWDITHKLFASFATTSSWCKNVVIDNVTAYNCRGETIFVGGQNHGKFFVKDSNLHTTNASTFSGSFDMEVIDSTISDSANAAMEVNNKGNQTDKWTAASFDQNILVRGCTIEGLKAGGNFEGLSGSKNFAGLLLFNEENTYQSVTDCTFRDVIKAAHGPWYEYRNGMRFNCKFYDPPSGYSGAQISLMTQPKTDYNIDGGMSETLWIGDKVYLGRTRLTQEIWMSSWDGVVAAGNQSPWIYAAVDFESQGGTHQLNRFWVDGWNYATGRQSVTFQDFTTTNTTLSSTYMWDKYPSQKIHPSYLNFFQTETNVVYAKADYGAAGDGVTDDTAKIQAAINSGADKVIVEAGTYKISGDINLADGQDFDASLATFTSSGTQFFNFQGTQMATYAMQANVAKGANQVIVPSGAAIVPGDWVVLEDNPSGNGGNNTTKTTPRELCQVLSNSGGTLTLDRTTAFDYTAYEVHKVTVVGDAIIDLGTLDKQRIDWRYVRNSSLTVECTERPIQNYDPIPEVACDNITLNADLNYGAGSGPSNPGALIVGWSNSTFNITMVGGLDDGVRLWGCANVAGTISVTSPDRRGIWLYESTGTLTNPTIASIPYAYANNIEIFLIDYSNDVTLNSPSITDWRYGDALEFRGACDNIRVNNVTITSDASGNTRNAVNLHAFSNGCDVEIVGGTIIGGAWNSVVAREKVDRFLLQDVTIVPEAGDTNQTAIYIGEAMNSVSGGGDQRNITIRNCNITGNTFVPFVARDEGGGGNTIYNLIIDGLTIDYVSAANSDMLRVWNTNGASISGINYVGAATSRTFDVSVDNVGLTVNEPSCNLGTGGTFVY